MADLTKYIANGIDTQDCSSYGHVCRDPRGDFLSVLEAEGFKNIKGLKLGAIQRVDGPEDKRGAKSAWYIYEEITDDSAEGAVIGIASYGDWKTGIKQSWTSRSEHRMSGAERASYHKQREAMRAAHEEEERKRHIEAAKAAYDIWISGADAPEDHPYLTKKNVEATEGMKLAEDGRLIIPIAVEGQITSLQYISGKGDKHFLTGGKIKGGWFLIDGDISTIYIAEGYATARSVHEATGARIYVAFNAGNIYEVASYVKGQYPEQRIIIAGDDDKDTPQNAGRTKAEQAAQGLGIDCTFPDGYVDFNDMHVAKGMLTVKEFLDPDKLEPYTKELTPINDNSVKRPLGILGDIYDYYNVTSGNDQRAFAVQSALAVCSVVLGRCYKTNFGNYSSLFLLNVAKSGTGKEHAKSVVEIILDEANMSHLIAGDGYTSAGAIYSTLLDRPRHISVIDEFGRYLEAARDTKTHSHQREANTKLMEAISRGDGVMRPPSYSVMTQSKDVADRIRNRLIHNPAITLLCMTTPDTLFNSLDMGAIKDGFFNRFIVSISQAKRSRRYHKERLAVPDRILNWIYEVTNRAEQQHIATEPANPIVLNFTSKANQMQLEYQDDVNIAIPDMMEKHGLTEISARTNEMAMKLALISALARDPHATIVDEIDMQFGIDYTRASLEATIDRLKISISGSEFEANKKEILVALRAAKKKGVTWSAMQKSPPFSHYKKKDLKEILEALKDADLAADEAYQPPKGGRPTILWIALK